MATKLKVPCDLAQRAIQEKIRELDKKGELKYIGKLKKTFGGITYVLRKVEQINVQPIKEHKELNKSFEFKGYSKLTFELNNNDDNTTNGIYSDGFDYIVRGIVTLKDDEGNIAIDVKDNKIEITDQRA